jgi:hypothetical protein
MSATGITIRITPPLAEGLPPNARFWFMVAVAGITILYVVIRPILKKKDPLAKAPKFASLSQQRSVERQMQNILVELSEMARQISAQLDTRAAKLELLIKEADEKLAALKTANAQPSYPAASTPEPAAAPAYSDPRYVQIYSLADLGRSARDIAQQLNRPSGEIELILALRKSP